MNVHSLHVLSDCAIYLYNLSSSNLFHRNIYHIHLGNKCFKVFTTQDLGGNGSLFEDARTECKKAGEQGYLNPDLASIANAEENGEW